MKFRLGIVLCVLAAGQIAEATPAGSVKISSRSKTVEIMDEALGIVAYRMEIPEDWKFEGVLLRDQSCGMVPGVALRATSPDGRMGYQALPQFAWHWSTDPASLKPFRQNHCKIMGAMTAAEFLRYVLPMIRPKPSVGPIEPTPDAKRIEEITAQFNARNAQMHLAGKESGGAVQSRIEYTLHGEPMEENLRVVVRQIDTPFGRGHTISATADVNGLRAPKGQCDAALAALTPMLRKAAFTDAWMKRQLAQIAEDGARVRALIKKQGDDTMAMLRQQGDNNAATMKRNHEAYTKETQRGYAQQNQTERERQDAVHQSAHAWTLYAGDEQLVRNPQTGAVMRVTNQAGTHGHQDSVSGDVIMTKDPNFDPNAYIRGSWTQLENVNPIAPH